MKLSNIEKVLLGITVVFLVFLTGFYLGRNQNTDTLTIRTERSDTAAATSSDESDVQADQASDASESSPSFPININRASSVDLTTLPGIGDVLASRIVEYRRTKGLFTSIEDIMNVSGVGEAKFEAIKDYITVR